MSIRLGFTAGLIGGKTMCLGIPMQIVAVEGYVAQCDAKGIARQVNLLMLSEEVHPGEFVMVHLGYAIQRLSEEEARAAWALLDEILATEVAAHA